MTMSKALAIFASLVFLAGVVIYALAAAAIHRTGRALDQICNKE